MKKSRIPEYIVHLLETSQENIRKHYKLTKTLSEEEKEKYFNFFIEDLDREINEVEGCPVFAELLKDETFQKMGLKEDELYKIFLFFRGGEKYKPEKIGERYYNRGLMYKGVLKAENNSVNSQPFKKYVENLHRSTKILLYHGTDKKTTITMLKHGLDLNTLPCRSQERYPEYVTSVKGARRYRRTGIYVSPLSWTASNFGGFISSFVKVARHLYAPNAYVAEIEDSGINIDDHYERDYPNSFRPSVSSFLLSSGEAQSMVRQSILPEEILDVTYYSRIEKEWKTVKIDNSKDRENLMKIFESDRF